MLPAAVVAALGRMGAKYLPSVKDQKANLRFQRKQSEALRAKQAAGAASAKPTKKK